MARLETLTPATQQVLRTASVIGRTLPHLLLEAVVDLSGDRLEEVLRSAVQVHVLRADDGELSFRHALLQEAVAASLLPGEAARTHRRIAEALTQNPELAGQGALVAGRLARHWAEAGDTAQALVASVAAAQEACDALAFAESLPHYERALELIDAVPNAEELLGLPRARLLHWAAEVAHLAAHPDRATELVREAIARVDPDDRHLHGWLHERLGRYLWMSADSREALTSYERAVAIVPAEPPTRGRAAVLSGLSQMLMLADRFEESEALAREAIAVAARIPDGRSVEGHARCNLGVDLAYTGRFEEAVIELRTARRIAEEQFDDVDDIARAMVNLHSVLFDHGHLEESAEVALESVRVVETLGLQRRKGVWSRMLCGRGAAHARSARRSRTDPRRGQEPAASGHRRLSDRPDGRPALAAPRRPRSGAQPSRAVPRRPVRGSSTRHWWVRCTPASWRSRACRAITSPRSGGRSRDCAWWTETTTPRTRRSCWRRPRRPRSSPALHGSKRPVPCWTAPTPSWQPPRCPAPRWSSKCAWREPSNPAT